MNVVSSPRMQKGLKRIRLYMIWGIIFLGIMIGFSIWAFLIGQEEHEAKSMNSLIISEIEESTFAKVEVSSVPYVFAEYDDTDDKYYFVLDADRLMYIVYLSPEMYEDLNREDIEENPAIISGMTKKIPQDVRALAIEAYNEGLETEFLTEENFEEYLGTIFLDTTLTPNDNTFQIVFAILSGFLGVVIIIIGLVNNHKTKKKIQSFSTAEWKKIEQELENDSTIAYESLKLYFTENYIVFLNSGIDIFSYQDILWMYPHILKQYGITTNKNIILVTKDKKRHFIANVSNFSKKSKNTYEDIMSFIYDKNPKMLVGYTKENIQEMKNLYNIS